MPRIAIRAEDDAREGLVEPFRHDYAISTDAAEGEEPERRELLVAPAVASAAGASAAPRWQ
jgi:hypothetical protein